MSVPPGPEPGQSLEDWVRESLVGPLPGDPNQSRADVEQAPQPDRGGRPRGPAADGGAAEEVLPPPARDPAADAPAADAPAADAPAAGPPVRALVAASAVPARRTRSSTRRRVALSAATGISAAIGIALVAVAPPPAPGPAGVSLDATRVPGPPAATTAPGPVDGRAIASLAVIPLPAAPAPVPVAFAGGRVDVGGGWWFGVTKPYLCPVLMTIPSLMSGDSRLIRMTVTIVNGTGSPQPARAWTLQATADGRPVEMVIWPAAGFRGVPDRVLAPGERVRFLVAVRLPAQRVAVDVTAVHPTGVRAALTGRV